MTTGDGAWGVMISHCDGQGIVTTRLWLCTREVAQELSDMLGHPCAEHIQTPGQVAAGAQAGAGSLLFHEGHRP